MQIAVVGIDAKLCLELQSLLESQGHRVALLPDPAKAFARISASPVHMLVIATLPSAEAEKELIRTVRGHGATRTLPILHVNPKRDPREVVALLDAGADDSLAKPFHGDIFLARVRTLLRRQIWSGALKEDPVVLLRAGELEVHLVERRALVRGQECVLTRLEFDLLAYLMRHKDRVFKRAELLEAVWKYPEEVETRTLDKHVETLRRKLGGCGSKIETVHGVGYRFMDIEPSPPGARRDRRARPPAARRQPAPPPPRTPTGPRRRSPAPQGRPDCELYAKYPSQ